jgi:hypothetical protein
MEDGIICESCGIEAPVKYVEFRQIIGAVFVQFIKQIKGNLCKPCIHSHFWTTTLTNLTLGWWGLISLFLAPVFSIMNIVEYLSAMGLKAVPADARVPEIDEEVMRRVDPYVEQFLARRVMQGEFADLAREVAAKVGVTPGQVVVYVLAREEEAQRQAAGPQQAMGFPVQLIEVRDDGVKRKC